MHPEHRTARGLRKQPAPVRIDSGPELLFLDAIATTAKAKNSSSGYRPQAAIFTCFTHKFCYRPLISYMATHGLKRLVLMEDFVGSGTQSGDVVRWAAERLSCPVLFVPLVIVPDGVEGLTSLASAFGVP